MARGLGLDNALADLRDLLKEECADLKEEAQQLRVRAERLNWATIEQTLRAEGYTDEELELEHKLFDQTIGISKRLVND
jgi:hypothetical protein